MPIQQVLEDITYANITLYSAAIPHYDDIEDQWDDSIDMCNEANISNEDKDEEYVR